MKLNEQEQEVMSKIDDKITDILTTLRDKNFTTADTRREFAQLIIKLCHSRDPRSRMAIRRVSKFFTELGDELLTMYNDEEGEEEVVGESKLGIFGENKMKRWKSIFRETKKLKEGMKGTDKLFDDLSDGSQQYFEKNNKDKGIDFLVNLFISDDGKRKVAPTLKSVENIYKKLPVTKYTKSLKQYLKEVLEQKNNHPDAQGFKYFDKGQVFFLKSVFSQIVQALSYYFDKYESDKKFFMYW